MHHPDPLELIAEMYRVARRLLFNVRVSPRIRFPLRLQDSRRGVLYHILPDDVLFDRILSLSPPAALVRFRVVSLIRTPPTRFEWTGYPHYNDVLGDGIQYHMHCFVTKGEPACTTEVIDDTPFWTLKLSGLPVRYQFTKIRVRRVLWRLCGPQSYYKLSKLVRR